MMRTFLLLVGLSLWLVQISSASPADAVLIEKEFQTAMEKWSLQYRLAATPAARGEAMQSRPDPHAFARRMWTSIEPSLSEEWTLEPSAWFLRLSSSLVTRKPDGSLAPAFGEEASAIFKAIETQHLSSKKLNPVCLALAAGYDPRSLALLQKIESANPDPQVQGTAALGAAMLLKTIGDDPEIMKKRLTLLRKAIIQSSEVEVNGTTVAKLAGDELYIIRYLTKGRVAPDLQGADSAKRPLTLSNYKGKVIVLLFWNSDMPDAAHVVQIASAMEEKFTGRSFVLIGVNNDPVEKLRALQADGTVAWTNFSDPENRLSNEYRVGSLPLAYVLDGERKVQYSGAFGSFVELTAEALLQPPAK